MYAYDLGCLCFFTNKQTNKNARFSRWQSRSIKCFASIRGAIRNLRSAQSPIHHSVFLRWSRRIPGCWLPSFAGATKRVQRLGNLQLTTMEIMEMTSRSWHISPSSSCFVKLGTSPQTFPRTTDAPRLSVRVRTKHFNRAGITIYFQVEQNGFERCWTLKWR